MTEQERAKFEHMRQSLAQAAERLKDQDRILTQLVEQANPMATVVSVSGGRAVIAFAGGRFDVAANSKLRAGMRVLVAAQSMQIIKPVDDLHVGPILLATSPGRAGGTVEVRRDNSTLLLRTSVDVEQGDRVVVDELATLVVRSLGRPESAQAAEEVVDVGWDDVGGCAEAKEALREAVELPYADPAVFAAYGKRPVRGVLLYGEPGNGKTMLAKALATAVARAHGHREARGFQYVKGPEVLSKFVGESEGNIRAMFAAARAHRDQHGYPGTIFIDEADALLTRRGSRGMMGMEATTVPQFLAEMDGMRESAALVVLATNRPDALDPAVVRDGRVDRRVKVGRPTRDDARQIIDIHLRRVPGGTAEVAERAVDLLYDESRLVVRVPLPMFVSGAILAGVVDRATTRALRRDLEDGRGCRGLTEEDVDWSVDRLVESLRDVDHTDAFTAWTELRAQRKSADPHVKEVHGVQAAIQ